jgi:hypothetical protein
MEHIRHSRKKLVSIAVKQQAWVCTLAGTVSTVNATPMFENNLNDIPTKELWDRILTLNEKTLSAPPHLRPQLYQQYLLLTNEYSQRSDK